MGKYTSNDNKSMQCNPNNERYWSSRGYDDDNNDDDIDESNSFNIKEWQNKKEKEYKVLKEKLNNISIQFFNKKIIFKRLRHVRHPIQNIEWFFENVSKEKDTLKVVNGITVKTKSFESFFIKNLNHEKLNKNLSYCSLNFIKDLFNDELGSLNKDVQENYVYFSKVTFSKDYIIFEIDPSNQGYNSYSVWNNKYSWSWANGSEEEFSLKPRVIYENFEDVLSSVT